MSLIIAFLIFSVIVVVHEFGHFIIARKNGILVEEFAVGMGPILFKKTVGETMYTIRALPLGGFCKMLGEDEAEDNPNNEKSFNNKTVMQRIAVISAGSIMNFILSFIIAMILVFVNGFATTTINTVIDDTPAAAGGLQAGDTIIRVDDNRIRIFEDVQFALMNNGGYPINLTVQREGTQITKEITPMQVGQNYMIGFTPELNTGFFGDEVAGFDRAGFLESVTTSFWSVANFVRVVLYGLVQLVTFNVAVEEMAGPVGIVSIIGDVYQSNIEVSVWHTATVMLRLAALISANLGVFNLAPFPALDGGRLVFLFLEAVRGKPMSPEREGMVHLVGFAMLMLLFVFVTFNDISRLF